MPPLQRRRRTGHRECTRARPRLGPLEVTKMRAFDMAVNFQANRWSGYLTRHRASPDPPSPCAPLGVAEPGDKK